MVPTCNPVSRLEVGLVWEEHCVNSSRTHCKESWEDGTPETVCNIKAVPEIQWSVATMVEGLVVRECIQQVTAVCKVETEKNHENGKKI